jgi:hypothetical protein
MAATIDHHFENQNMESNFQAPQTIKYKKKYIAIHIYRQPNQLLSPFITAAC